MKWMISLENDRNLKKYIYLDILRVLAIYLVLFTHTGIIGNQAWTISKNMAFTVISIFLDAFRCINTSLFLMISGALLLGKEESYYNIYCRRLPRIVCALFLFSAFYFVYWKMDGGVIRFFQLFYNSNTDIPLWYLYYYISFLLILPLLKKMAKGMNQSDNYLFMILGLLFTCIYPLFINLTRCISINGNIDFWLKVSGILYPITGYYLHSYQQTKRCILCAGIISAIVLMLCCYTNYSLWIQNGKAYVENGFLPSVYPTAVFVFMAIKKVPDNHIPRLFTTIIRIVSRASFGIYLLGDFLLVTMRPVYSFAVGWCPSIIAVNIYLIVIILLGTIIITMMRKIYFLKDLL